MTVVTGTVLTQPQLYGAVLLFQVKTHSRILTVIRTEPEDKKRDLIFLCVGQQVILCGCQTDCCILAAKIRIVSCAERNYLETTQIGDLLYGDPALPRTDFGNPKL